MSISGSNLREYPALVMSKEMRSKITTIRRGFFGESNEQQANRLSLLS